VREFSATYPQINVRLHELSPSEQHAALVSRRTDISFLRRPPDDADLVTELGWTELLGVALPLGHPLAAAKRITLSDLKDESHVFLHLGTSRFAQYLWQCCVEAGFTPKVSQQAAEAYSLISLVAAGFGVAVVPERIQTLAHPGVVHRLLHGTRAVADVMMIYRPDPSAVLATFLQVARDFLASQLPFEAPAVALGADATTAVRP
jgi:DNA-binding transcriptional LysR family regulator